MISADPTVTPERRTTYAMQLHRAGRVDGREHRAAAVHRKSGHNPFANVGRPDADAVTAFDTARDERAHRFVDTRRQFGKGPSIGPFDHGFEMWKPTRGVVDELRDRAPRRFVHSATIRVASRRCPNRDRAT